jgi:VWFA-related protein
MRIEPARRGGRPLGADAVAVAVLAGAGLMLHLQASQVPVFRSSVEGVTVSVSVQDGKGPVSGLSADAFELLDNGVPQRVTSLSVERLPLDITLLVDLSASVDGARLERIKRGIVDTARDLVGGDRLKVVGVQHHLRLLFDIGAGEVPPVDRLQASGGTALYDAIAAALVQTPPPDRRPVVVVYTDGLDSISTVRPAAVHRLAEASDAVLHAVVPRGAGIGAALPGAREAEARLAEVAAGTGGQLFTVTAQSAPGEGFGRALATFRTSYVLRFVPEGVRPGGWHSLSVKVKGRAYQVRARKGYGGGVP